MRFAITLKKRYFLPGIKPIEIVLLAHSLVLLWILRSYLGLEPQPLWGLTIGVPFLKLILYVTAGALVLRALLIRGFQGRPEVSRYLRSVLRPVLALDLARILIWIGLTVYGYAWLKVFVPLINSRTYDSLLYRIDNFVHFGLNPNRFLIALFPYPWFLRFLDNAYSIYHYTVIGGLCWFMVASTRSERYRFVGAYALLWVMGSWLYLVVPSLGPCYTLPGDYVEVKKVMTKCAEFQDLLIRHYFSIRQPKGREITMAIPAFGVAAFPSLHVAGQFFLALWSRRRNRLLFVTFTVLTFITLIASLISGWHYAIDDYAALAMAYVCVWLFEKRRPSRVTLPAGSESGSAEAQGRTRE